MEQSGPFPPVTSTDIYFRLPCNSGALGVRVWWKVLWLPLLVLRYCTQLAPQERAVVHATGTWHERCGGSRLLQQ